jgi:hypothetical protein
VKHLIKLHLRNILTPVPRLDETAQGQIETPPQRIKLKSIKSSKQKAKQTPGNKQRSEISQKLPPPSPNMIAVEAFVDCTMKQ